MQVVALPGIALALAEETGLQDALNTSLIFFWQEMLSPNTPSKVTGQRTADSLNHH